MEGNRMAARTLSEREREREKNKVVSFSTLFFMCTLRWITAKELERVIKSKGDEFQWKNNMKISWRR